ncbi:MAG: response regulator transcription factor [Chloroflexi bacterium]|nr:response regulator transcription factor [Chloroflexota bacterium]
MDGELKTTVAVCENQPITAEGLRALINLSPDLEFAWSSDSLPECLELARRNPPALLIVDKAFGARAVLEALASLRCCRTAPVVWGISMTESEALRFVQAGAKAVLRKSADPKTLLVCLRAAARGETWMEQEIFQRPLDATRNFQPGLTCRERQVMELVGQGLNNREIASELGIRPGTVKVHLKHVFEKTGVRGRYGLALSELNSKPVIAD